MNTLLHLTWRHHSGPRSRSIIWLVIAFSVALIVSGCDKKAPTSVNPSDANGYQCNKCKAKFYAARDKTAPAKCPTCNQGTMVPMGGFVCGVDQHMNIRPQGGDRFNVPTCEKCSATLTNMMVFPKSTDFEAWGATKL